MLAALTAGHTTTLFHATEFNGLAAHVLLNANSFIAKQI